MHGGESAQEHQDQDEYEQLSKHVVSVALQSSRPTRHCSAKRSGNGTAAVSVVFVIPLVVEYAEDEDTGCGLGAMVIAGVVIGGLLLMRLAITRAHR